MTRLRKKILGVGGSLLALFLITIGPWPLDRSPDEKPEVAALKTITLEGLDLQKEHAAKPAHSLFAGWASEAFALPEGVPLAGYGARHGAASTGMMPDEVLAARSLVLRSGDTGNDSQAGPGAAILCADLLLINKAIADAVTKRIQSQLGSQSPVLFFTATHTHSGPGAWGEMVLEELIAGRHDPRVVEELVRALSASVIQAVEKLEPASYAWIDTQASQFMRNRSVSGGEVDGALEALVVKKSHNGEEQTAMLTLFGAHATCLPDENLKLSGDYPGHVVRILEADERIDFAAFSGGNMGSHSPVAEGHNEIRAANMGKGLAKILLQQLDSATFHDSVRLSAFELEVPTPPVQLRIGSSLRTSPVVTGLIQSSRARLSALRLDDRLWVGVPMEVSGLLSKPLRTHALETGLSGLTISNFHGDYLGYMVPNSLYADGSVYESQMSFLGPTGGSYFDQLIRTLIDTQAPNPMGSDSL